PSQSGGRSAYPGGSATTTWRTSGWPMNWRSARSSIGTPRIGRNCFGSPGPARTPAPAATTTTPTSGGETPGELTDSLQSDHFEILAPFRTIRQEYAAKALTRGFGQTPLDAGDGTNFAAQPHFAEKQCVRRNRPVVHGGDQRGQHRQIRRRLDQAHTSCD